ncbi:uncharacterized protein BXZ73DRAFT_95381 [Epithele typhae]|uniref:uncharacterized protein n=1 Tax=Epithele typhae TaxID=378194 RepID=UPI002007FF91|nr:uncharacterized protein BXZ73DRAFT_95381 [Epithele typhae]KAH9945861.1 hypothetical protein BXZ73DRAFT_95381 [Epithele typhae]
MSSRPARPQPIPAVAGGRPRRRSPSAARSTYAGFPDAASGHTSSRAATPAYPVPPTEWPSSRGQHPRPGSAASGSSGSDLLFPMDSERGSSGSASSSRRGSFGPAPQYLYDLPTPSPYGPDPDQRNIAALPVCTLCRRQYYPGSPTSPSRGRSPRDVTALCPVCQREEWEHQRRATHRSPTSDASFSPASDRTRGARSATYRDRHAFPEPPSGASSSHPRPPAPPTLSSSTSASARPLPAHGPPLHRPDARPDAGPATHANLGRPFPAYRAPSSPTAPRRAPSGQTRSAAPWTDPYTLPPAELVVGPYQPAPRLPQLIAQVRRPAEPSSHVSRPRTADPFGATATSMPARSHHRRGQ